MSSTLLATPQDVVGRATEFASLYVSPWVASTAYAVGATASLGGNDYVVLTAGTSGTVGPTGYAPAGIADGSVVWGFTTLDPVTTALNDASLQVNASAFGVRTQLAQAYLAAHLLSVRNPQLALPAGPVKKDIVGQVQAEYAVNAAPATESDLNTSRWGQAFRTLSRQLASARIMVLGGAVSVYPDPCCDPGVFVVSPGV